MKDYKILVESNFHLQNKPTPIRWLYSHIKSKFVLRQKQFGDYNTFSVYFAC